MAEAAVSSLLEQINQMVAGYGEVIAGAENEFMLLNNELSLLKAIVKDVQRSKKYNNVIKVLEGQIKDGIYEIEDAIETLLPTAIKAESKKNSSLRSIFTATRFDLAKEVKSIREGKLTPLLSEAKVRYALVTVDEPRSMEDEHSRDTTKGVAAIRQERVIGFDGEVATINGYLREETKEHNVISIVGMAGQGKTTLAWKVYQSEEMCFHFPIRIWISISQVFNSRDVFIHILKKFVPSRDWSGVGVGELAQEVRLCLEREKFLLVLDDVWSVEAWNEIKVGLPMDNGMGKVIITGRDKSVAMHSSPHRTRELQFLDRDESWTLLRHEVFGNLEDCPPELEEIGKALAFKCEGVPLTLVVIGGILFDLLGSSRSLSKARDEWKKVLEFETDALLSDKAQRITGAVDLSYNRLPDRLKECFLYLGVFPQNYLIPTKTLTRLWICEGFILPEPRRSLEEIAEEILTDLIYRNLLKAEKISDTGIPKTCRVPKLIHAFCSAKSKEEGLFLEMRISGIGALEPPISEVHKSHRLCLHSRVSTFLSEKPILPNVRSFLCFNEQPVDLGKENTSPLQNAFPKLRILEVMSLRLDQIPPNLTRLIHLRYLTLYIKTLPVLPETITQLWNLQALVVVTRSNSITMKANLWRMVRLRHINTNAAIVLDDKMEVEAGHNLQTLDRLSPESCTQALCTKATNLRTLGITGKLYKIFEAGFLERFHLLENLKLVNKEGYEVMSEGMLHRLPKQNCFPPSLKRLALTSTCLDWEHMSMLAMIKGLESLKLKDNALIGMIWSADDNRFPSLQLLLMENIDLVLWRASVDSFPKLRFLTVNNCSNLREIPECLGTGLEKLEIKLVRHSVVESAKKIAETKEKSQGRFGVPFNLKVHNDY